MFSSSDHDTVRCIFTIEGDTLVVIPTRRVSTALGLVQHPELTDDVLRSIMYITVRLQDGKLFSFQAYLELAELTLRHRRVRACADIVHIVTDGKVDDMRRCAGTLGVLELLSIEPSPLTRAPKRRRSSRPTGKE